MAKVCRLKTHRISRGLQVYINVKIRGDSSYPFSEEDEQDLVIEIKRAGLLIRKRKEGEEIKI